MKYLMLSCLLVAGCGGGQSAGPDAGPDANPDAAAPPGGDPVTVYGPSGAPVLFYDSDGSLVDRQLIGAGGSAQGHVTSGGTVTLAPAPGTAPANQQYATWFAVEPGDVLAKPAPALPVTTPVMVPVTLPRDGDASSYDVSAAWFFGQSTMAPPATGPITIDATSNMASSGPLVAEAFHTGAPSRFFVAQATLPATMLDLTSSTWVDATPVDVALTGVPSGFFAAWTYTEWNGADSPWNGQAVTDPGTPPPVHFDTPGPVGDAAVLGANIQILAANSTRRFFGLAFGTAPASIDLSTLIPGPITAVALSAAGDVTWTASPGPAAEAMVLVLGAPTTGPQWTIVAPGDRTSLHLPALPTDVTGPAGLASGSGGLEVGNEGYRAYVDDAFALAPSDWVDETLPPSAVRMAEE